MRRHYRPMAACRRPPGAVLSAIIAAVLMCACLTATALPAAAASAEHPAARVTAHSPASSPPTTSASRHRPSPAQRGPTREGEPSRVEEYLSYEHLDHDGDLKQYEHPSGPRDYDPDAASGCRHPARMENPLCADFNSDKVFEWLPLWRWTRTTWLFSDIDADTGGFMRSIGIGNVADLTVGLVVQLPLQIAGLIWEIISYLIYLALNPIFYVRLFYYTYGKAEELWTGLFRDTLFPQIGTSLWAVVLLLSVAVIAWRLVWPGSGGGDKRRPWVRAVGSLLLTIIPLSLVFIMLNGEKIDGKSIPLFIMSKTVEYAEMLSRPIRSGVEYFTDTVTTRDVHTTCGVYNDTLETVFKAAWSARVARLPEEIAQTRADVESRLNEGRSAGDPGYVDLEDADLGNDDISAFYEADAGSVRRDLPILASRMWEDGFYYGLGMAQFGDPVAARRATCFLMEWRVKSTTAAEQQAILDLPAEIGHRHGGFTTLTATYPTSLLVHAEPQPNPSPATPQAYTVVTSNGLTIPTSPIDPVRVWTAEEKLKARERLHPDSTEAERTFLTLAAACGLVPYPRVRDHNAAAAGVGIPLPGDPDDDRSGRVALRQPTSVAGRDHTYREDTGAPRYDWFYSREYYIEDGSGGDVLISRHDTPVNGYEAAWLGDVDDPTPRWLGDPDDLTPLYLLDYDHVWADPAWTWMTDNKTRVLWGGHSLGSDACAVWMHPGNCGYMQQNGVECEYQWVYRGDNARLTTGLASEWLQRRGYVTVSDVKRGAATRLAELDSSIPEMVEVNPPSDADIERVGEIVRTVQGLNVMKRVLFAFVTLATAVVFLLSLGGLTLGVLLAQFILALTLLLLPLLLLAAAIPREGARQLLKKLVRVWVASALSYTIFFTALAVLMLIITMIDRTAANSLPISEGSLPDMLITPFVALLSVKLLRAVAKNFGVDITSFKGALEFTSGMTAAGMRLPGRAAYAGYPAGPQTPAQPGAAGRLGRITRGIRAARTVGHSYGKGLEKARKVDGHSGIAAFGHALKNSAVDGYQESIVLPRNLATMSTKQREHYDAKEAARLEDMKSEYQLSDTEAETEQPTAAPEGLSESQEQSEELDIQVEAERQDALQLNAEEILTVKEQQQPTLPPEYKTWDEYETALSEFWRGTPTGAPPPGYNTWENYWANPPRRPEESQTEQQQPTAQQQHSSTAAQIYQ